MRGSRTLVHVQFLLIESLARRPTDRVTIIIHYDLLLLLLFTNRCAGQMSMTPLFYRKTKKQY